MKYEAVVIGVSAGGINAIRKIIPSLPPDFDLPVIIVQHRAADSDDYLERDLDKRSGIAVKQADEKEIIRPGTAYVAPPNYHLLIERDRTFSLSVSAAVNYARPSIDTLFETAAWAYGPKLIGIILTGANSDGSNGLKTIKENGGLVIVQDPATAEVGIMPNAAIAATEVDHVLPLDEIGAFLVKLVVR